MSNTGVGRIRTPKGFVKKLRQREDSATVANPYRDFRRARNLALYLEYMMAIPGKRVLLVGEAPGYKGCGITGIPFSSGRIFSEIDHPLMRALDRRITLPRIEAENTAAIVWRYLADKSVTPLFWNAFPFHPHPANQLDGNRAPTAAEIAEGVHYLQALQKLFKAQVVAGIGKAGLRCAQQVFPQHSVPYIRHPSYGGKRDFTVGMDALLS